MYTTLTNSQILGQFRTIQEAMNAGRKAINEAQTDGRVDVRFRGETIPMKTAIKKQGEWKTF